MDFSNPERAQLNVARHRLDIRFTGSGSEYFRIWIVNLLLTLVTFGLYYPWAKVRRLRYFYGNTLVGDHPLDFHGEPGKMLRGNLLVGALFGLYSVAGRFSSVAEAIALLLVAAVWPALMWSATRFRLANTSWRGLRLHFSGPLRGAYAALLPAVLPALGFGVVAGIAAATGPGEPGKAALAGLGVMTFAVGMVPWLWHRICRYQHDHYRLGQIGTRLAVGAGGFYGVFLRTGVCMLLVMAATGLAAAAVILLFAIALSGPDRNIGAIMLVGMAATFAAYVLAWLSVGPYFTSRMQNLLWGATRSSDIAFDSQLRFRPLCVLTLKNLLLMALTLGLYWPFARVALARLRLEAVSVQLAEDPDVLVAGAATHANDATGDAAGDLFGFDIGL